MVPERLLLAHSRGKVLFLTGSGTSRPSGLPTFQGLVLGVYRLVDPATYEALLKVEDCICEACGEKHSLPSSDPALLPYQKAEIKRYRDREYDVVLGMLERRIDSPRDPEGKVRKAVVHVLTATDPVAAPIHRSLIKLADRGISTVLATTNQDLLLEDAARRIRVPLPSHSLGAIPQPSYKSEFAGVLHIHGAAPRRSNEMPDLVVTDQDFGAVYLRGRFVPDFIYDAARLYDLVMIGYSAEDPPMRYLLNAVAADTSRFSDLRERFAFVGEYGSSDPVRLADWRGRGITPIPYPAENGHEALSNGLERWSKLSTHCGKPQLVKRELRRISSEPRESSSDAERDLFDHLVRRSVSEDAREFADTIARKRSDIGWLDSMLNVLREPDRSDDQ